MRRKKKDLRKLTVVALSLVAGFALSAIAVFAYFFLPMGEQREQIVIPTLVGKRLAELETDDNLLIESELVFSDTVPEGEIVSQSPYAGAIRKVEQGKRYPVRLTVSLGKECLPHRL